VISIWRISVEDRRVVRLCPTCPTSPSTSTTCCKPRERLAAAIDGVDEWARADATPSQQEITRIRRLIGRIDGDLGQASDTERAVIDEAVTVMRRHRAAFLGMPSTRATAPDVCPEATA